ncbi:MAG TPA: cation:proton antiporter [Terriglobales bacterium]|nr:cation:proton antiporter [Terriglobales bacterium]
MYAANLYHDLAYVFVAAVLGGLAARALRQPLILGYVLAGIVLGPFTPGPSLADTHALEVLAEIGVILLMYSIGIEFHPSDLLEVKWVAVGGGVLGILLSIGISMALTYVFEWPLAQGFAIGAIVSVASTMVLSRLLIDRGELHSNHGKVMIAITLFEDVAVVILTVIMPALSAPSGERFLDLAKLLGKALVLLIPLGFVATRLIPSFLTRVARMCSEELFVLVTVALGFGTAYLTEALGLSLALGAFLGGMLISGSDYAHEMLAKLFPIRDIFVALFFVTMGALANPRVLLSHPGLLAFLVLLIVVGKFVIWTGVVRLFRFDWKTAVLVGVGLTQIGEFSYVLVQEAKNAHIVQDSVYNATLMASLITILLNSFLVRLVGNKLTKSPPVALTAEET